MNVDIATEFKNALLHFLDLWDLPNCCLWMSVIITFSSISKILGSVFYAFSTNLNFYTLVVLCGHFFSINNRPYWRKICSVKSTPHNINGEEGVNIFFLSSGRRPFNYLASSWSEPKHKISKNLGTNSYFPIRLSFLSALFDFFSVSLIVYNWHKRKLFFVIHEILIELNFYNVR